ncbi:MAG: hypothetical protein V1831_00630 [Candidatus Woesearchaeota archaeon]
MSGKRKAQGLSITTIIVAVIALIVLVVLIAVLTGNFGRFSGGVGNAASCNTACKAFGKQMLDKNKLPANEAGCEAQAELKQLYIFGDYSDVDEGKVCCCEPKDTTPSTTTPKPTQSI